MRKICSFILTICLMAMVLCVNAFAAEAPAEGIVLRVSGETGSGEIAVECLPGAIGIICPEGTK